jgi:hypothetical protein
MTFKVTIKGQEKLFSDIEKALNKSLQLVVMNNLGKMARDIIYRRTKAGKGVNSDTVELPKQVTLKPLTPGYIKYRSKLAKLGSDASARRSNLTLTGQMLDAIEVEAKRNGFVLTINNNSRTDGKSTNQEVAGYASKARPFFALTDKEQKVLFRELETKLREELKKSLGPGSVRP